MPRNPKLNATVRVNLAHASAKDAAQRTKKAVSGFFAARVLNVRCGAARVKGFVRGLVQ